MCMNGNDSLEMLTSVDVVQTEVASTNVWLVIVQTE